MIFIQPGEVSQAASTAATAMTLALHFTPEDDSNPRKEQRHGKRAEAVETTPITKHDRTSEVHCAQVHQRLRQLHSVLYWKPQLQVNEDSIARAENLEAGRLDG